MQIKDYFRIFSKRIWIIVIVMVIAAAGAFAFSQLRTPIYRSTIYLNVIPARLDLGLTQSIKSLMRNYAGQIMSKTTASEVIDRLELDVTTDELISQLSVSPIEEDYLIQIDADDYSPELASSIAQTTAEVFVEYIEVVMLDQDESDRVQVTIRDSAEPGTLFKPKWKINTLAGAILGLLAGFVVVVILEWLESDTIRDVKDLETGLDIAVLGAIPASGNHDNETD